jgi:hypothetical protein
MPGTLPLKGEESRGFRAGCLFGHSISGREGTWLVTRCARSPWPRFGQRSARSGCPFGRRGCAVEDNGVRIVDALTRELSEVSSSITTRTVWSGRRSVPKPGHIRSTPWTLQLSVHGLLFSARLLEAACRSRHAWFTQRAQSRRESVNSEIKRRERVYTECIAECSKLAIDALDNTLKSPSTLIEAYALQNRIRLASSDAVVDAAEQTLKAIVEQYSLPNITIEELRINTDLKRADPLQPFSEACRNELRQLQGAA